MMTGGTKEHSERARILNDLLLQLFVKYEFLDVDVKVLQVILGRHAMSRKLLTKPGEKRLAVNDFKFRIPQVLFVQLIVVELIAAHLLDHYSFQVY